LPAAVSASAIPPVRPLAPSPSEADSNTRTERLGASLRNQAAVERPEKAAANNGEIHTIRESV